MTEMQAAAWISENLTAIYGYAFARLYDKNKVDELVSEIICAVLSSVRRLRKDAAFYGFVWRTAENTFRKFIRRDDPACCGDAELETLTDICGASAEDVYIEREEKEKMLYLLRRELSLLSQTHREVCVAYYAGRKSCSRIAEEQGISVEMVKYHLFKTRKLLKEGIGMTRTLGEKSYNPGVFRLDFWGDRNKYQELFRRKLPGSILLAAYYVPMTAEELSVELGVSMPYLEDELEILMSAGLLTRNGSKYQTNLVILTDDYEKEFVKTTEDVYPKAAGTIFEAAEKLLPQVRKLDFHGSDYDDNRLLFALLNIALIKGYQLANEKSPLGEPKRLPLGCSGWVFGYDNDYANHHFYGIMMECWNREGSAYFSVENYRVISPCQRYDEFVLGTKSRVMCDAVLERAEAGENEEQSWLVENGFVLCKDGILSANFPVFRSDVFAEVCALLAPISETAAVCMQEISDEAERVLKEHVPSTVKDQCGDIAKIHHRLDAAAFLMETWIADGKLVLPAEKIPLCVWGVRK